MVYHYSGWIIIWSILYYFKLVQYPPLRFVILSALAFSILLLLKYKVQLCYIILSALLHSIPLFLVDNKKDNMTIYINIIAFCSYVILMNLFNINIAILKLKGRGGGSSLASFVSIKYCGRKKFVQSKPRPCYSKR